MKHRFQKGNKAALGHDGRRNRDPLSQVLISQLHEIDHETGQEKKHLVVANLIKAATGYYEKVKLPNGKTKIIHHEPEAWAIKEIFDRVEGKAPQAASIDNAKEDAAQIGLIERV